MRRNVDALFSRLTSWGGFKSCISLINQCLGKITWSRQCAFFTININHAIVLIAKTATTCTIADFKDTLGCKGPFRRGRAAVAALILLFTTVFRRCLHCISTPRFQC